MSQEVIKSFKGFNPDFSCGGMQYEVGKEYEMPEGGIKVCSKGFHACESPLEVLDHYFFDEDGKMCRFAEVEQSGKIDRGEKSTMVCSSRIKIKAELKFGDLVRAGVERLKEITRPEKVKDSDLNDNGNRSAQIGSSGDSAKIDSTGEDSVICCAGHNSRVRAKLGSWITLAEWAKDEKNGRWVPKMVKTIQIDGVTYKPDTWYMLKDGEIVEAK